MSDIFSVVENQLLKLTLLRLKIYMEDYENPNNTYIFKDMDLVELMISYQPGEPLMDRWWGKKIYDRLPPDEIAKLLKITRIFNRE